MRRYNEENINKKVMMKFTCLDLDDISEGNDPYCSYSSIYHPENTEKAVNRLTKINCASNIASGEYIVSTNYISNIPYHSASYHNSHKMNISPLWGFGIVKKNHYMVQPKIYSIKE